MAYKKYYWKRGDKITAARLNNLEEGCSSSGGNGTYNIHFDIDDSSILETNGSIDFSLITTTSIEEVQAAVRAGCQVSAMIDTSILSGSAQIIYLPLQQINDNDKFHFGIFTSIGEHAFGYVEASFTPGSAYGGMVPIIDLSSSQNSDQNSESVPTYNP